VSARAAVIGLSLALVLTRGALAAQELPLKRPPEPASAGECPALPAAGTPRARHTAVDSLLSAGSRAAILGDYPAAEELLRRAAQLDGANPVVSYRLARTLDDQGKTQAAALEYCRYLALAPDAPDAAEIRGRVRDLVGTGSVALRDPWTGEMAAAVTAYESGRLADAVEGFTRAIALRPDGAEGYYNRGVAYVAMQRADAAAQDLEAYLRLAGQPEDAPRVRSRLELLTAAASPAGSSAPPPLAAPEPRRTTAAPGRVLIQGLVLPGLGQHETGRTLFGLGVLSAVGGAVYLALHQEVVVQQREGVDPFGNRYPYDVRVQERPYQSLGIGAAVGIGLAAAVESFLYARGQGSTAAPIVARGSARASARSEGPQELQLSVVPSGAGVSVGLRWYVGSVFGAAVP
jgi:Flp pilus assembly protein TadD